ncbi:MAG: hypothetical protein B1H11_00085 [Desulfobacteraceae bacterium 4484_190.1]|nr:MAG: hypothetical protein B1H11_00085 [Desulfobacteraceae bacterium 4484_190.1]
MGRKGMMIVSLLVAILAVGIFTTNALAEKPKSITVALIGDLTGPYASVVGPMAPGAEDACKYINNELGGIDGVKIKLVVRDNTGKASLGLQQYAELIGMKPKPLFFGVPHTPTAEALRSKVLADDVIGFFPSSIADIFPVGNTVGFYALYPSHAALFLKWLKENWKEKRNPRVAIITWNQAYGKAILTPEVYAYAKKIGVDIVATELFGTRDLDLTTQMVRIRAKKPDWLLTNNVGSGPVAIMRAVKELGMKVKLANSVGGGWGTVRLDPSLFEDCVAVFHCESFDNTAHPGMKKIMHYLKINNRSIKEQTNFYIIGWQYILMVKKVIRDVVAEVGWDNMTTAKIKEKLFSLNDWQPLDGVVRVTYSKKLPASPWMKIYKIKGGKLIPADGKLGGGEWVKCPDMTPAKYR